jgi:uncharacterized membrane protein
MDEMDACAGDMQWMVGWCMGAVPPQVAALAVPSGPAPDTGTGRFAPPIDFPGALETRALGINPRGDIVGSYTGGAPPVTHGYLLRNGVFTTIDYPSAPAAATTSTEAWGINSRGDIIGRYTRSGRPGVLGFLLSHGRFTDISIASPARPDGKHLLTLPTKIGASREIVGCFHDASPIVDMFGYVQRGSTVTTFGLPSTSGTSAMHNGIARGGRVIVGLTFPAPDQGRGYVLSDNAVTYIDFPGSNFTLAWDLNSRGTIVGFYRDAGGKVHGFYRDEGNERDEDLESDDAGRFVTIDPPGSLVTQALGINARGDIVGVYADGAGTHGFLLTRPRGAENEDN